MEESVPSPSPIIRPAINWKYYAQQYFFVLQIVLPLFVLFSIYLFFRRGYYDLYIVNKIFAGIAALLLGMVLLLGPGSRMFAFPDRFMRYRKELGIAAFLLALLHVISSLFFLPNKFPLSGYIEKLNWPFIYGLSAIFVLGFLFFISNARARSAIGTKLWWPLHYWGLRISFALVFLHVYVMKWNGWVQWYRVGGTDDLVRPEWPGAGLLVGWILFFVVIMRLSEKLGVEIGRAVWQVSFIALPIIFIFTFWWGSAFAK